MQNLRKFPKDAESAPPRLFYEFGPFRVDSLKRLLYRDHELVALTPKAFDLLLALLTYEGAVLTKDELLSMVWPDTVVEEGNLNRNISTLRRALGEAPDEHRYIVTVPGTGYRFVAEVRKNQQETARPGGPTPSEAMGGHKGRLAIEPPPERTQPATRAGGSGPGRSWFRHPFTAAAILLAALALLATWMIGLDVAGLRERLLGSPAPAAIHSLAVLPLDNLSRDPDHEYFADGLTDELITDLAEIRGLRVVSHTSVIHYKGSTKTLPQIARELGVDAVVEGSVERSGDRVRIRSQLILAHSDTHLWAESYEGNLSDTLSLEREVAEAIAGQIRVQLTPEERARLARAAPVDPSAYELYLKGRAAWNERSPAGLGEAVEYFGAAVEKDPNYAPAYAGLADSYALRGLDGAPPSEVMPRARAAALKALQLDDELPEAHTSLAGVLALYEWDWAGAEREFRRALELNPQYAPAHHWYAVLYLAPVGRTDEAIAEMQRAVELDPTSSIFNTDLGWTCYVARRFDEALAQYRRALAMDPAFVPAHFRLSELYLEQRRYQAWVAEVAATNRDEGNPQGAANAEHAYARGGYQEVLRQQLEGAEEASGHISVAVFSAALGQDSQALPALERAVDSRLPSAIYLKVDPEWDGLRSNPAFKELLRRVGFLP